MNRICVFFAAIMLILGIAGCSAPDKYKWIQWYDFRGHCFVKLNISVETEPDGAEVLVGNSVKGTTPCSFVYESTSYIQGEKRELPPIKDGSAVFETRETEFLGKTEINIIIRKRGYKPFSKSITLEDYFLSDTLDHKKTYEKSLKLSYRLKKD